MNFVKTQLAKAERLLETVEEKIDRSVLRKEVFVRDDDDKVEDDDDWRAKRRSSETRALSDDSDLEDREEEDAMIVSRTYDDDDDDSGSSNNLMKKSASFSFENDDRADTSSTATAAMDNVQQGSPSKALLGKPPSPANSTGTNSNEIIVARNDEEYKLKEKIILYRNKVQDLKSERDHYQRLLRDMQNESIGNNEKMLLKVAKLEQEVKKREFDLKERDERIKSLVQTEKIKNEAEDEAETLTKESISAVLAAAKEAQARSERQAESANREVVSQREDFAKREADLEDQLERLMQDVAKVSQTSEERARALVNFERRAITAETDFESLEESVQRLESNLAAETARAERAENDGEYEKKMEVATAEAKQLRKDLEQAMRRAEIAERDLKVRGSMSSSSPSAASHNNNTSAGEENELITLRKQSNEMSELLFEKQKQLESLQSEKQTWSMRLERAREEYMDSADVLANVPSSAKRRIHAMDIESGRMFASSDAEIVPMEASRTFSRLARNKRVGKVVTKLGNLGDFAAATLSDSVRLYPIARVSFFGYLFFIHFYAYFLLHKLQHHAHLAELHLHDSGRF